MYIRLLASAIKEEEEKEDVEIRGCKTQVYIDKSVEWFSEWF